MAILRDVKRIDWLCPIFSKDSSTQLKKVRAWRTFSAPSSKCSSAASVCRTESLLPAFARRQADQRSCYGQTTVPELRRKLSKAIEMLGSGVAGAPVASAKSMISLVSVVLVVDWPRSTNPVLLL